MNEVTSILIMLALIIIGSVIIAPIFRAKDIWRFLLFLLLYTIALYFVIGVVI